MPARKPPASQLSLFVPEDVYSRLRVAEHKVFEWFNTGFLSFNPRQTERWERWMCQEVVFVRDLMRTELSLNTVRRMLSGLERPYAYSGRDVFYDFSEGCWRRRYDPKELVTLFATTPDRAVETIKQFIEVLERFGHCDAIAEVARFVRDITTEPPLD